MAAEENSNRRAAARALLAALIAGAAPAALAAGAPDASPQFIAAPALAPSFPPSCLDYPLPPPTTNEPRVAGTIKLFDPTRNITDDWRVTFYRRPCEGGRSAVLVHFSDPTPDAPAGFAPVYPEITLRQANIDIAAEFRDDPRSRGPAPLTALPMPADARTLALTGTNNGNATFDANEPMQFLVSSTLISGPGAILGFVQFPFYTPAAYPEAGQPLPIDGYVAGSYFDPEHAGEGILFEAGDQGNDTFVFFAWFTYDAQGRPYWLTGNTTIARNARTASVPTLLLEGGGFAGAFGANVPTTPWGNVTFTFLDCNNVRIDYTSTHALAGRPTGSGTRTWTRLTTLNGLRCR